MTTGIPVRPGHEGDLFDRVMVGGDPQHASESLLNVLKSGRARPAFYEAVLARLGTSGSRDAQAVQLRSLVSGLGRAFGEDVAACFTLPTPTESADQIARILYLEVERGISDIRIRPVLAALVTVLDGGALPHLPTTGHPPVPIPRDRASIAMGPEQQVSLPDQPMSAAMRQAEIRTEGQSQSDGSLGNIASPNRHVIPPPSVRLPEGKPHAEHKPQIDKFRVLDAPVRSSQDEGDLITVPLFAAAPSGRPPGPVRLPSALPPPPDTQDADRIRGWLRGEPSWPDAIGVSAGLLFGGEAGDLMELEAAFHTDALSALWIYKARSGVSDGTADAAWCGRLGRDIGRFTVTHDDGVLALARTLANILSEQGAERIAPLVALGANLTVREELAEAVCGLIDAERDYLDDAPASVDGPPQNLLGAFSPSGSLAGGRCLERALRLHLSAAVPLGTAMRQSLSEFRLAQALRANPSAPYQVLAARYERDPAYPLEELSGQVAIIRIGYTEPPLI